MVHLTQVVKLRAKACGQKLANPKKWVLPKNVEKLEEQAAKLNDFEKKLLASNDTGGDTLTLLEKTYKIKALLAFIEELPESFVKV